MSQYEERMVLLNLSKKPKLQTNFSRNNLFFGIFVQKMIEALLKNLLNDISLDSILQTGSCFLPSWSNNPRKRGLEKNLTADRKVNTF